MTNYTDVKIDENGEFVVENGDLVLVTGNDETLQRVNINLHIMLGEWILDPNDGFDFFGKVANKKRGSTEPRQEIERVILGTEGIKNISSYEDSLNGATGKYKATIKVIFDDGEQGQVNV